MDEERQRDALPINNDRYLLESPNVKIIKKLDVSAIENIETMEPFAWMLVGKRAKCCWNAPPKTSSKIPKLKHSPRCWKELFRLPKHRITMSSTENPVFQPVPPTFQAGYVAVIGLPNAGKSTLLNHLIEQKLSIVTDKPQTTRKNVLGHSERARLSNSIHGYAGMIDPRYNLQEMMMRFVKAAINDADLLVYVLDVSDKRQEA
ncbi:MAG: GTPase [Calditrichia bacterium]